MPNKFIITRKDLNIDPVVIESEGLLLGRSAGCDLVLNHPSVSREHAGIKEINGDYWVSNFSQANGTLLNGEQVERTPLADGDLIQIGPFFIHPTYEPGGLALRVELSVRPLPVEATGSSGLQSPQEEGRTVLLSREAMAQREKPTRTGTLRLTGTGMLTGRLAPADEQALKIFWDARKREAGKLAEDSPLKPRGGHRLGKAQFNWRPTRDLQRAWPVSLFVWGAVIVAALAAAAAFLFTDAYAPGALSAAHARGDLAFTPAVAREPNAGSCTTCHGVRASMQQNCAGCHTTPAFHPEVSAKHTRAGIACAGCHDEHHGRDFRPALVANSACTGCHRDGSGVFSPLTGRPLGTPHGGSFGYPVVDGRWRDLGLKEAEWRRKELPGTTTQFPPKEQFHLVHVGGRQQGRTNCSDCHAAGFEGPALLMGLRESCASCHGIAAETAGSAGENLALASARETGSQPSTPVAGGPLCVSCHAQHGEEKELRAALRRMERPVTGK